MFGFITKIKEKLSGYKTYILVTIGVLGIIVAWLDGKVGDVDAFSKLCELLGLGTLRAGVKK